uniref:Cytochrome P450 n=1 Tax=Kalanchoe fedtschenkoi TaxID=63787 RepID=A0A7N1A6M7_KALFE
MEIAAASAVFCVSLVSVLAMLAYRFLDRVWLKPKRLENCLVRQGLSGSTYRLLYGDSRDENKACREANSKPINLSDDIVPRLLPYVNLQIKKYGGSFVTWSGPTPKLFLLELDLVREVFARIGEFHNPHADSIIKLLASGVASYNDDKWAKHRMILNPAFHLQKLKNMVQAFHICASEITGKWETLVSRDGSCELDVWPDLHNLTRDIISRTAFGSSFEEGRRIFELQKELIGVLFQATVLEYIPGYRFLPTQLNRKIKVIDQEIRAKLRAIIVKKKNAVKAGTAASDDLLGILIESNQRQMKELKNGMTIEDVIEECKLFYFAGQETTANLLVWTMILLSQHEEWQARAREEVQQVFGDKKPNMDGINQLKILNMILHEVLRLYPPIMLLTRATYKETKLGDFTLPSGVNVCIPILMFHHDPKLWGPDAREFNPLRFAEGVSKASKGHVAFLPFGWGPRICIGQNFALLEAKVVMVVILQRFSFKLSPSYTHAPCCGITAHPQHGAHLVLHKN